VIVLIFRRTKSQLSNKGEMSSGGMGMCSVSQSGWEDLSTKGVIGGPKEEVQGKGFSFVEKFKPVGNQGGKFTGTDMEKRLASGERGRSVPGQSRRSTRAEKIGELLYKVRDWLFCYSS